MNLRFHLIHYLLEAILIVLVLGHHISAVLLIKVQVSIQEPMEYPSRILVQIM